MTAQASASSRRIEHQSRQKRIRQRRRDAQQTAERYEARPLLPEPEPTGLYRP